MSVIIPLVAADGAKSTVTLPAPTVAAPSGGGFFDDFLGASGSAPNPAYWTPSTANWTGGTAKYKPANVYLDGNSHLVLKAKPDLSSGAVSGTGANGRGAVLLSWGLGLIEANIQVPKGFPGSWPAWWVVGTNFNTVGWPNCGEMDIYEGFSSSTGYYSTVHGPGGNASNAYNQAQVYVSATSIGATDLSTAFHTYWINRVENSMSIGIDSHTYATWTPASLTPGATWLMNENVFPILNFGLSGTPTADAQMLIDWVRFTPAPVANP